MNLDDPLPVHITYRTAWIDHNGIEQFRGDIYGRDAAIAKCPVRRRCDLGTGHSSTADLPDMPRSSLEGRGFLLWALQS